MITGSMIGPGRPSREQQRVMVGDFDDGADPGACLAGPANGVGLLPGEFRANGDRLVQVMCQCDRCLPEAAIAGPRIELVSAAAEQARAAVEILSDPEGEEKARPVGTGGAGRRQYGSRKNGRGDTMLLIMDEAILDAELNVPSAAAPALEGIMRKAQRQGGRQLNAANRTVVQVQACVGIEQRVSTFAVAEAVNLPVAGVRRDRIIGEVRWSGERRRCPQCHRECRNELNTLHNLAGRLLMRSLRPFWGGFQAAEVEPRSER